jgi:hypothetical protein
VGKQAGASTPRSRGAYGSTRGKERQRRRADNRAKDPRYQAAMEEVRKAQEELDALVEDQKLNPAKGAVAGAMYATKLKNAQHKVLEAETKEDLVSGIKSAQSAGKETSLTTLNGRVVDLSKSKSFSTKHLPQSGDGNFPFAPTMARKMLAQGYHIKYVLEFTGVGYEDVRDIEIDNEGWGIVPEEEENEGA